jgi:hypothetical protein
MGIPFPSMYDPLGLTEDQKKEMNKITDELKVEFDRLALEEAKLKSERLLSTPGALLMEKVRENSFASQEEFKKALSDARHQTVPSEEMRKKYVDLRERGTKLVTSLQARLMDVLTDAQLDKMQKILDETPRFAKQMIAQSKAQQAQKKSPQYVPGPDSWRPGDPVPVQFKEERRRNRFPRNGSE